MLSGYVDTASPSFSGVPLLGWFFLPCSGAREMSPDRENGRRTDSSSKSESLVDAAFSVDVIIPVYNERPEALVATLSACTKQTRPVNTIFVVDDYSPSPLAYLIGPKSFPYSSITTSSGKPRDRGGTQCSYLPFNRPFLACVNTEVLPDPDWVATCLIISLSSKSRFLLYPNCA